MTDYIIREMAFGALVGAPFAGGGARFKWHGVDDFCELAPAPGLEYKPGSIVLQKVYAIVEQPPTGSGPVRTIGAPAYQSGSDTVTRSVTLSDPALTPALTGDAKTAAVNAEADRRLLLAYPLSEQIWGALRASQIIAKKAIQGQNLTAGETSTLTAIGTAMTFVDAVRTSRLALINNGDKTMAQIVDNANWPAQP
jgi:hypothetical protein